jgi:hypothetical protein
MTGAGVFGPEDRLELLDGEIIDMAPQKSRHATAVTLVGEALRTLFRSGATVRVQLPFSLDDRSEPEPDVAVVPGNPRDYRDAHPSRALLICEVSDTTLGYDRGRKLTAYARAGIPEYWILAFAISSLYGVFPSSVMIASTSGLRMRVSYTEGSRRWLFMPFIRAFTYSQSNLTTVKCSKYVQF